MSEKLSTQANFGLLIQAIAQRNRAEAIGYCQGLLDGLVAGQELPNANKEYAARGLVGFLNRLKRFISQDEEDLDGLIDFATNGLQDSAAGTP